MPQSLPSSPIQPGSAHDRARGALLGLAVGDAVGTTVEFQDPGEFPPLVDMEGGGPFGLERGQWTDDTSMALCLAESLLDRGGHDPHDQMRRYVLWWQQGYLSSTGRCFDIGTATRRQLSRFVATGELVDPHVDQEQAANGSLMRLAPVAIRWSRDPRRVVDEAAASSRPTHPAARPVDACKLLAAMTAALIRGEAAEAVLAPEFWQAEPLHPAVEQIARGSWRHREPPEIRGTGYCIDALEAALWAVGGAEDFRGAILRAANLGDDADTTAAIAGQLAGAMFGASGIPRDWLAALALRPRIESLADRLHAAGGGAVPHWSHDDLHHAWAVEHGDSVLLVGEYPGVKDGDEARTRLRLSLLADAGVDTIVDLTHPADRLNPYEQLWQTIAEQRRRDLRRVEHPIVDLGVIDQPGYERIVAEIEAELTAGRGVYVHCWGGVGRAPTVVGTWLRQRGLGADEALRTIATARAGTRKANRPAPETGAQEAVVRGFGGPG